MRTVGNKTSEARRLKNTLLANPFVPYDENLRYMHIAYARTHTRTRDMNAGVHSRENVPYVSIYQGPRRTGKLQNCRPDRGENSFGCYNGRIIKLFEYSQKLLAADRCKLVNRNCARAQISLFNQRSPSHVHRHYGLVAVPYRDNTTFHLSFPSN